MRARAGLLLAAYAAAWALAAGGAGVLPAPPVLDPAGLRRWWVGLGPVVALFSAARAALAVAAVAVSAVLTAATVVGVAARAGRFGSAGATVVAEWYRRRGRIPLVRWVLGVSVSGGALAGCGLPAGTHPGPGPAPRPPAAPVLAGPAPALPAGASPPVPAGPAAAPGPAAPVTAGSPPGGAARLGGGPRRRPGRPVMVSAGAGTWTVRPGDDFWSIAERVVAGGPAPGPARPAVAWYWERLVAANAGRLPVAGRPDLLFPGDVVVLPPLPAPSR